MNRKFNKKTYLTILALLIVLFFISCENLLETPPEDSQTREEFWSNKGDVEASMVGIYDAIQGCIWKFFVWGEIRGEILETEGSNDLEKFAKLDIDRYNHLIKWNELYSAMNRLNTVIKFAPLAEEKDNTFSKQELNEYIGECMTLRAMLNFYLARTFIEFPYITEPSDNDQQDYNVEATPSETTLDLIVEDLLAAENMVKKEYDDEYFEEKGIKIESLKSAYRKGRVSQPVVWALLTDVCLTKGDYENAVKYADSLINHPNAALEQSGDWHSSIFVEGNSEMESIFELQYNNVYKETSDIASWFIRAIADDETHFENQMNRTTQTFKLWQGENPQDPIESDIRGINGQLGEENLFIVWKWAGLNKNDQRDRDSEDANWIFYRLADIILMKAEALNRLQKTDDAIEALNTIRERATSLSYITRNPIETSDINELEELILDERGRELAAEGKRWYDLVRIAKRQNNYKIIGNRIAEARTASVNDQISWKGKVFESLSWYLPIHKDEMDLNSKLNQNPYYINR